MSGRHVVGFRYPAPKGATFLPGTFDSQIGEHLELSYDWAGVHVERSGTLLAAQVDEDGQGVLLMMEVDEQ